VKLRQMLVRTHMEELREHTNDTLYENYRTDKLRAMGVSQDESVFKETRWVCAGNRIIQANDATSPAAKQMEERTLHEVSLFVIYRSRLTGYAVQGKLAKMEAEMKKVFQQKVQEKEQKLKQSEEELYARHREMKEALDKQRLELEDKKRRVESGRPLTPEKGSVRPVRRLVLDHRSDLVYPAEEALRSRQVIGDIPFGESSFDPVPLIYPSVHRYLDSRDGLHLLCSCLDYP